MEKVSSAGPWREAIAKATAPRDHLLSPEQFYDLLRPLCSHLDIWHTHYNHMIGSHAGVVEWFKGSSLRPFYSALQGDMREQFLATYTEEIARAYPARADGKVMLKFPRLFIVAVR
jgi:trans-aconitate 2-methyltransferase